MFRLGSLSKFIISLRFSGLLMYLVIVVKLCLSSKSSPRSCVCVVEGGGRGEGEGRGEGMTDVHWPNSSHGWTSSLDSTSHFGGMVVAMVIRPSQRVVRSSRPH